MADAYDGVLFDNDALSLIGAAGLLPETLALLGIPSSRAFCLESLTHMLQRGQIGRSWTAAARADAVVAAAQIQVWRDRPSDELLQRFVPVVGIDSGEALLFGTLVEHPSFLMVSGDKRAMIELCAAPDLADVRDAVAGRVVCLETLLDGLVSAHGSRAIGQAFTPVLTHVTLRVVFTATHMADVVQCRCAINSYLRDLQSQVSVGFLFELQLELES